MLIRDFINQWKETLFVNVKPQTIKNYNYLLKIIDTQFGDQAVENITVETMAKYLITQPSSKQYYVIKMLEMMFRAAYFKGIRFDNPSKLLIKPKQKRARPRLTAQDLEKVYELADTQLKNYIKLARITAQRPQDILNLKNVHEIKDNTLHIKQNKTGNTVDLVIGEALGSALSGRFNLPPSVDVASRQFTGIMRQLKPNQPTPTLYEIRSLGLIEHEQRGGNPQALAGHSRSMQTLTYLRGHDVTKKVQSI